MYPILSLSITGLITLYLGFNKNRDKILLPSTILFLIVAIVAGFVDWNAPGLYFNDMLSVNNFGIVLSTVVMASALLIVALSDTFKDIENAHSAEYLAIIQFSLVGAIMMITFQNLLMLFIGIEILSVSMYVLTGSDKRNIRGNEAAIKYFLMGAFATGIFLFGVAMTYGGAGSFDLSSIASYISTSPKPSLYLWIGLSFLMMGLLFKVSAAPFHWWTADVYEGAPTIFTTYMSTIVKTGGFIAIFRVAGEAFGGTGSFLSGMLILGVVASMIIGNLMAVLQESFKRMLAFSSISHAGYMLLAVLGFNALTGSTIAFYSIAYTLATISAFGVLMIVSKEYILKGRPNENISIFNGLFKQNSFLAVVLIVSLLSLSGIPLTGGFWGKFFAFQDVATGNNIWILFVAILGSAIGIYYYFRPIIACFKEGEEGVELKVRPIERVVLSITTLGTLLFGLLPDLIRNIL